MEKPKTASEIRKAEFDQTAKVAKSLADMSLREIDAALADEEELRQKLDVGVAHGNITELEADGFLEAYHKTRFGDTID